MIRLAVVGTHSVGKTTLVHALRDALAGQCDVAILPEVAREMASKGFKLNTDITEYGAITYAREYLRREREVVADVVLSDRSSLDLLAYLTVNRSHKIRTGVLSMIREVAYLESLRFDEYLYLPIEFPLSMDALRPADVTYQKAVDTEIVSLLSSMRVKWTPVQGTVAERVQVVISIIERHLHV